MSEDFYDDPDLQVPEGSFVKWDEPKTIVGTIKSRTKGTDLEGRTVGNYSVELDDGAVVTIGASHHQLKSAALENRWAPGDRMGVTYKGKLDIGGGKTVNDFDVETKKSTEVAAAKPAASSLL